MIPKSNLHTHTSFCDGKNTAEEMTLRAIELGYESIGFSSHAYTPCDPEYCMSAADMPKYRDEIFRLMNKYEGRIDIYLGLELDICSKKPDYKCDYTIGSVHYLKCGQEYIAVDDTPEKAEQMVNNYFGGDWYSYAEAYYAIAANAAKLTGCSIVGHFDLLTKFNEGSKYFDESNIRYKTAAIDALRKETETCSLFEINTGAMYRKLRAEPYPSLFILKELKCLGGEVILSSDSHDLKSIGYKFDFAAEIARECGFKSVKQFSNGKFIDILL